MDQVVVKVRWKCSGVLLTNCRYDVFVDGHEHLVDMLTTILSMVSSVRGFESYGEYVDDVRNDWPGIGEASRLHAEIEQYPVE